MDEHVIEFGAPGRLRFLLRWRAEHGRGTAAERTRGELAAFVGDRLVWGQPEHDRPIGFLWTWIELLEHLAEAWRSLEWEQCDPLGLMQPPEYLRISAEYRWSYVPQERRDREEQLLWEFEQAHDLSRAVQGAWLPALWVVRQGAECVVAGQGARVTEPAEDALGTLERLASAICEPLRSCADGRAMQAIQAWESRRHSTPREFAVLATGLDEETLSSIGGVGNFEKAWELQSGLRDNELLAVARFAGMALPADLIRRVVQHVRRLPHRETPAIDELVSVAPKLSREAPPYDQGHALACWLRAHLGLGPSERGTDPGELLRSWGVKIHDIDLGIGSVDAVCAWGPSHGPGILVNPSGKHAQSHAGRRATLAHEVCHLLVDRDGALPLAEVLGGRGARETEARARAFAAEYLLPRALAGESLARARDPKSEVQSLARRFEVSREIVAWQARNSTVPLSDAARRYLRTLVSEPRSY